MAGRLITFERSAGCVLVTCSCGYRTIRLSYDAARAAGDNHRRAAHPRQATYVESKRRLRTVRT
jgi:hypothetical protein